MKLIVNLNPKDGDYKVIDALTGSDVTSQVYKIELLPFNKAKAYLYRHDKDGHKYKTTNGRIARLGSFPVVKIYGKKVMEN